MIELWKKGILNDTNPESITREKIEKISKDLVKQGCLSEQEGNEIIHSLNELIELIEREKNLELKIEPAIFKVLTKFDVARKEDIRKLEKRIAALEKEKITNFARMHANEI